MALLTFKGGIHPDDGKSLAKDKAIVEVKPKGDLVYPVSQHIGAPANPVVAVGDHVLKGQMIAEAGGFVSAPIYASVSGTVKAIAPHLNPTGGRVNSIEQRRHSECDWNSGSCRYGWCRFPYQSKAFTEGTGKD